MPQRAATISSLPMAFELAKALRADGLNWSEGYRPLGRRALAEIIEGRMAEAGFARGSGVSGVQGFQGFAGTRYELPNFTTRSRRQTFSIGPPRPSTALSAEVARRRQRGGRLSRWRMRRRARPDAPSENRRDNFFPIIGIRAMVNHGRVRRGIAGPLVAAETRQKLEKTRFRLDRPTTP